MSDLRELVEAARAMRERGDAPLVATVVAVNGSSYRKPGARMLFSEERWLGGSISAGCLERDVVAKGAWRTRNGAQVVTYDASHDERIGTGCDGVIDVLIERAGTTALTCPLHFIERCLGEEQHGVLITAYRSSPSSAIPVGARIALLASGERASTFPEGPLGEALAVEAERTLALPPGPARFVERDGVELLIEHVVPPIHLFLFGSAPDAVPVVELAQRIGWTVSVCDERAQLSTRERFRGADHLRLGPTEQSIAALNRSARPAAVAMAHHYERDLATLSHLLRARTPYIGILGSRLRSERLLADLRARPELAEARFDGRIHAPVGLAIHGESPREIALSIIAEVQQFYGRAAELARAAAE